MNWLWSILAGVLATPLGFVTGTALAYGWFWLHGEREHEGRRGLLAGTIGGPLGAILGFYLGFQGAWLLLDGGGGAWRGLLLGCLLGLPSGAITGALALALGTHLAERRGVSNYAGERAAWGLYHLAIPTAILTSIAGFVAGWWLTRS